MVTSVFVSFVHISVHKLHLMFFLVFNDSLSLGRVVQFTRKSTTTSLHARRERNIELYHFDIAVP